MSIRNSSIDPHSPNHTKVIRKCYDMPWQMTEKTQECQQTLATKMLFSSKSENNNKIRLTYFTIYQSHYWHHLLQIQQIFRLNILSGCETRRQFKQGGNYHRALDNHELACCTVCLETCQVNYIIHALLLVKSYEYRGIYSDLKCTLNQWTDVT